MEEPIRLTKYSKGAGCGCKIAPDVLEKILYSNTEALKDKNLLVGTGSNDDAAVYDLGDGTAIITTTDFFMPVTDDAFDFGRIAAANAISDVYAMGGTPLVAIAILGWPIEKLPAELAQQVLNGGRAVCSDAGIVLAGGHSVDSAEPIFGLAVTGRVKTEHLKKNNTAREGDLIFLTKPLGTGILSTAQKREVMLPEHREGFISQLSALNKAGEKLGKLPFVTAMTDVTGFGLLGHLVEMAEGAGLGAELNYAAIPVMDGARDYLKQRIVPDATYRNWNSYSSKVDFAKGVDVMEAFNLLPDPQTNGGLLFTCSSEYLKDIEAVLSAAGISHSAPIGRMVKQEGKLISVKL